MPAPKVEVDEDGYPVEICCPSCDALLPFRGARCGCDSNFRYAQEVSDDLERVGEEGL